MQAESPPDSLTKLSEAVVDSLRARKKTLAVAESCTGGCLSAALTSVAGASRCFLGSWIVYSNQAKLLLGVPPDVLARHGAVSQACTHSLATLAAEKLATSYALSLTGFAGPSGCSRPYGVGTCFIGLYHHGATEVKQFHLPGPRARFQATAASWALRLLAPHI